MTIRHSCASPTKALFCVSGLSPQILTETLIALCVVQSPAWVPQRVEVLTTSAGRNLLLKHLLDPLTGHFHAFCRDYGLSGSIQFDESCIHVVQNTAQEVLADIVTPLDNSYLGDQVNRCIQQLIARYDEVHVSIAGGRKTMAYYAGSALSLYGRAQDRMSHVLVNEPFERVRDFYYPPKPARMLPLADGSTVSTADARVMLADLPFLRLGGLLPPHILKKNLNFAQVVALLQGQLSTVWLDLDAPNFTVNTAAGAVKLQPILFTVFAWFAWVKKLGYGEQGGIHAETPIFLELFPKFVQHCCLTQAGLSRNLNRLKGEQNDSSYINAFLSEKVSQIRQQFKQQLLVAAAAYDIVYLPRHLTKPKIRILVTDAAHIELNMLTDWQAQL